MSNWMRNQLAKLYNAVSAPVAVTRDTLAKRLQSVRETASLVYNRMTENMEYGRQRLKDIVEKKAEEEAKEQQQKDIDLTPHEHERTLKGAYRYFVVPGAPKTDIEGYFDKPKSHIKTLIEDQMKEMESAKIIMTLWVRWKKPIMSLIELDPEDAGKAQDVDGSTSNNYIRVEMPFNSPMTKFFEGSDINDLIQRMFAHIKTQAENARLSESDFTLDQIMHLHVNFPRLALIRRSCYMKLPE